MYLNDEMSKKRHRVDNKNDKQFDIRISAQKLDQKNDHASDEIDEIVHGVKIVDVVFEIEKAGPVELRPVEIDERRLDELSSPLEETIHDTSDAQACAQKLD